MKRTLWPCITAWWARFWASMVLPTPLGPTKTRVGEEAQLQELLDQWPGDLLRVFPVKVDERPHWAEACVAEPAIEAASSSFALL